MRSVEIRLANATVIARIEANGEVRIDEASFRVDRIADGQYRVTDHDRQWMVAVAGPPHNRWIFVDGQIAQVEVGSGMSRASAPSAAQVQTASASHDLSAPMPATVIRVIAQPGNQVTRGETLLMLEAMKMEVPIRAPRDGRVRAVHCQAGDLVQPGVPLLDLE